MTSLHNEHVADMQEPNGERPEGWISAKLPEIAKINMGQSPPGRSYNKRGDGLPFFQGKVDFGDRYPIVRVWCSQPKKIAHPGDVFISVRAPVGPTNVANYVCAIGRGLAAISPLGGIPSEFIFFRLRFLEPKLALSGTGSTFSAISRKDLEEIDIDVPPLAEQKRIVTKVEELLALVNATKDRLNKVSIILKRFRQAVLAAACSGRLTADWRNGDEGFESGRNALLRICGNMALIEVPSDEDTVELPEIPEEWVWSRCEYLCEPDRIITYGVIKLGQTFKNGVGTLRSSDVRWLYIDKDHIKCISPDIAVEYSRTFLKGGEILVTVRGSLGGVAVVPKEMAGYNISREVAMLPLHPEFDPGFFSYAIASIWSQNWLLEVTKGVAYTGINIRDLKRLPLPVPPIPEQHEIVRRVESMFKLADAVEKRVAAATVRANKLTQAILAKAFRGELVPTEAELARRDGRPYETASKLLAHIKSERESKGLIERRRCNKTYKGDS
jgi:type I restriction enzyme, S subunit